MSFPIPELVPIPAGEIIIGAVTDDKFANSSETPTHVCRFESPFQMGKYPIRQDEWQAFQTGHPGSTHSSRPVVNLSWYDACAYVDWLRIETDDRNWRLPTEEEWEYACRAGSRDVFSFGNNLAPDLANFHFDESIKPVGPGKLTEVDAYPPNPWGLHDLHGNTYEWTNTPWRPDYKTSSLSETYTVRGGSWDGLPRLLRTSAREGLPAKTKRDNLGIRIAYGGSA